jgi:hypothetical protein
VAAKPLSFEFLAAKPPRKAPTYFFFFFAVLFFFAVFRFAFFVAEDFAAAAERVLRRFIGMDRFHVGCRRLHYTEKCLDKK